MPQPSPVDQISSKDVFESFRTKSNSVIGNTNRMYSDVGNVESISTVLISNNVSDAIVELSTSISNLISSGLASLTNIPMTYFCFFPGEIVETTVGNEFEIEPYLSNSRDTYTVESVQITSSQMLGDSGNTIIVVSDSIKDKAGANFISVTLPYDSKFASNSNGSIEISSGDKIYVYCSESARHQDVQVNIHAQE